MKNETSWGKKKYLGVIWTCSAFLPTGLFSVGALERCPGLIILLMLFTCKKQYVRKRTVIWILY